MAKRGSDSTAYYWRHFKKTAYRRLSLGRGCFFIRPSLTKPRHGLLSATAGNGEHKAVATLCLTSASECDVTMQVPPRELP